MSGPPKKAAFQQNIIKKRKNEKKLTCLICSTKHTISDCDCPGLFFKATIGYPSKFDGDNVEGFLCDKCIARLYTKNLLKWIGNCFCFSKPRKKDLDAIIQD